MSKFTTENIPDGKFRAHGRISIEVINKNIIVYHSKGPFNLELLTALEKVERGLLQDIKNTAQKWSEVVVFEESCMALDEVLLGFSDYLKELKANGLSPLATAYVISSDIEGSNLMEGLYEQCHREAKINFSIFCTESEAISWVSQVFVKTLQ